MKRILDKIPRPPGAIPARAQTWLLVGLTAAMAVTLVTFPGQADGTGGQDSGADGAMSGPASGVGVASVKSAADRIREEAARNAEQRMRAELGLAEPRPDGLPHPPPAVRVASAPGSVPDTGSGNGLSADEQIEREERIRRYRSLSAPSLVLSARSELSGASAPKDELATGTPSAASPHPPATVAVTAPETDPPAGFELPLVAEVPAPTFILREGELLEAVLTNRLSGDFVGPVNAMVSADVYDRSRQRLLVPRGTRVLGQASPVQDWGQSRLAVTFHRLILPDGASVDLAESIGLNQIGETGLRDRVNRHYMSTLAAAGAVGALAGFSQATSPAEAFASRFGAARLSVGAGLSQAMERILDRYLNRFPKVTIREGHRIRIYLTRDLTLPAYRGTGDRTRGNPQ